MKKFKYIYGPVASWRLGRSLGVDLLAQPDRICTFNCIYCQLGQKGKETLRRRVFVPTKDIIKEIKQLPKVKIDYITFSGTGEPTLAKNLGEVILKVKKIRKESIAVITNSTLIYRKSVREELKKADCIMFKLDASDQITLNKINKPVASITFERIINGLKTFRREFNGRMDERWTN